MSDNRVIDIIKLVGLEGLFRAPSREIDHGLISALVERWRPETHTFHLSHGEMSITLQDVVVILGLLIDGEVLVGPTGGGDWSTLCEELLGFAVSTNDKKTLVRQKILINRLVEHIAKPLPHDAMKIQIHQYAQCYILALLGDKIFMDKLGDGVHLIFLEFLGTFVIRHSIVGVVVAWHGTESCAGQAIKRHCGLVGRCNWSSIGHGQGCHSCARR